MIQVLLPFRVVDIVKFSLFFASHPFCSVSFRFILCHTFQLVLSFALCSVYKMHLREHVCLCVPEFAKMFSRQSNTSAKAAKRQNITTYHSLNRSNLIRLDAHHNPSNRFKPSFALYIPVIVSFSHLRSIPFHSHEPKFVSFRFLFCSFCATFSSPFLQQRRKSC